MPDLKIRFPDRIAAGMDGGPEFSTTVVKTFGGQESRNINWPTSKRRFNVSNGVKTDRLARLADAYFRKARGRGRSFPFKDWSDFQLAVVDSRLVAITSTTFQLCKVYGWDEPDYEEVVPITIVTPGALRLFNDGVEVLEGVGAGKFTVDQWTGIVTYGTAPGAAVRTALCTEYLVCCRFDFDVKSATLVRITPSDRKIMVRWDGITIMEVPDE